MNGGKFRTGSTGLLGRPAWNGPSLQLYYVCTYLLEDSTWFPGTGQPGQGLYIYMCVYVYIYT